jgi:hypothetical protein
MREKTEQQMTNNQLADEIKRYRETAEVGLSWLEISSILHRCEAALRSTPEPEVPSRVCWLAMDKEQGGFGDVAIHDKEPGLRGSDFFNGGAFECVSSRGLFGGILAPGQKCRVTFGPVIDCNPKPEPVKSLGQVLQEFDGAIQWRALSESMKKLFEQRADAIVAEYERRKGGK